MPRNFIKLAKSITSDPSKGKDKTQDKVTSKSIQNLKMANSIKPWWFQGRNQ